MHLEDSVLKPEQGEGRGEMMLVGMVWGGGLYYLNAFFSFEKCID